MRQYNVFVVDDHPLMRRGYQYLLNSEPDLRLCGEAGSVAEAHERIPTCEADLVIIDSSMGGMSGLGLIKDLLARNPDLLTLVVSSHDETMYGERAIIAGARGYVMKNEVEDVIVTAIRRVLNGGHYVTEALCERILSHLRLVTDAEHAEHAGDVSAVETLSDRELEVFELIGRGLGTSEIADQLAISPKTVESHRGRIKKKLGLGSSTRLLQRATIWVESQP